MSRYPEWFIGGPWHGKDKLRECPNLPGPIRVGTRPELTAEMDMGPNPVSELPMLLQQVSYVRQTFVLIDRYITIWLLESDLDGLRDSTSSTHARIHAQLLDLIMHPHEVGNASYENSLLVDQVRNEWDRERRESRNALVQSLNQEIRELRLRNQDLEMFLRQQGDANVLGHLSGQKDTTAGVIELVIDGRWYREMFGQITTYFDSGDEDNPASWVATAQGDRAPVYGYGTTPKAAVLALLADAVNVYARMIDTSEKPRLK